MDQLKINENRPRYSSYYGLFNLLEIVLKSYDLTEDDVKELMNDIKTEVLSYNKSIIRTKLYNKYKNLEFCDKVYDSFFSFYIKEFFNNGDFDSLVTKKYKDV